MWHMVVLEGVCDDRYSGFINNNLFCEKRSGFELYYK